MNAQEILTEAMRIVGLSKNSVGNPFESTDQQVQEFVAFVNYTLVSLTTEEGFSQLSDFCDFKVYSPWAVGQVNKGESRTILMDGVLTRVLCTNSGLSDTPPYGSGEFSMNKTPKWAANAPVTISTEWQSNKSIWRARNSGTTGTNPPLYAEGTETFVDNGVIWEYVREVLYWRNMGDPNKYPLTEICPDFEYMSPNTTIDITLRRPLAEITDEMWQKKRAMNTIEYSCHYMLRRKAIWLYPQFSPGDVISFGYSSKNTAIDINGVEKAGFSAIDDESILPSWLVVWGVAYRWLASKSLPIGITEIEYNKQKGRYIAEGKSGDRIRLDGGNGFVSSSIPDGNWEIGA